MNERSSTLAVLPALPARPTSGGKVVITQKFAVGMEKYLDEWGGPITAFMQPTNVATTNLDEYEVHPSDLPFHVEVIRFDDPKMAEMLAGHRLALCSVDPDQTHFAELCRSVGVPCVYVAEYSLKTRNQVIQAITPNPIVSLRRQIREYQRDRRYRRAIKLSDGVQCNGTPTFDEYREISPSPLLYFDTRATEDLLITPEELEERGEALLRGEPLRLLFSGRLVAMKGADHLVRVAKALRKRGVPFLMTICGGGDLEGQMKADIERFGLADVVTMAGVLRFADELTPFTKHNTDLFVCCHTTGDPACTYLEVMGCGVPFVGFANEALEGVIRNSGVGWLAPMRDVERLADRIAEIDRDRPALLEASRKALEFVRLNTFDRVFKARIEHMKSCCTPSHSTVGSR